MKQSELTSILPFNNDQKQLVDNLIQGFNDHQLTWLAGYLTGITLPNSLKTQPLAAPGIPIVKPESKSSEIDEITVLFGSRTGNGLSIANQIKSVGQDNGIRINIQDMNEYPLNKLKDEKNLLVIVSTHGEGVPPIAAEEFYNFLHGKRAPKLTDTKFSVLALGDSSYVHFCKTGKDVDQRLEALGGKRVYPRVDCDVDFLPNATNWISGVLESLGEKKSNIVVKTTPEITQPYIPVYTKQNPFQATLLDKIKLNGRGSGKETFHYELSLENSGIQYAPGDSLGIYPVNSNVLVGELLTALSLNKEEQVEIANSTINLEKALTQNFEISNITSDVITKYNEFAQSKKLTEIVGDTAKLTDFIYGRDVVDLLQEFPVKLSSTELLGVLRKLQPRLYSIASSLKVHPDEVHLTVASVRYNNGRNKEGACSTFLSDRLSDETIRVFIEKNPEFKLPSNPETPIIMVGPGTGIAPFRAFLEERKALDAKGKNWLFFGDRNFSTDFLYQTELQNHHKKGLLTNLNVAFSRDNQHKVYVQHKMQKHSRELFSWLEDGAHFYVCGDMKSMWNDVNHTLLQIIEKEGGMSAEKAEEYLKNLKKSKRYLVDVY